MAKSAQFKSAANGCVRRAVDRAIEAGDEIGIQVVAYLDGEEVINQWAGLADRDTASEVRPDTLFNVYSVSKAISVTALHLQVERGLIEYDAPVVRYWPEYGTNGKEATTVRDVITHRAGVPQMPEGTTPEEMCDWSLMTKRIAALVPVAPPGTKALYQAMTYGWLVGEIVRRSDSCRRSFGEFIRDELAGPLDAPDIWIGVPRQVQRRVAKHVDALPPSRYTGLAAASMPANLVLVPAVFNRPAIMRAEIPAVGGVFSAQSCARFWAMLAQGGELDGVRLLSPQLVATFNQLRRNADEPDPIMLGNSVPLTVAGFWLGGNNPPVATVKNSRAICHPGVGGVIGWADFDARLAVAICHNRMFQPTSRSEDPLLPIADAVREALHLG